MNDSLSGNEVVQGIDRTTTIADASKIRDTVMENYRTNSFLSYFVIDTERAKNLNAHLLEYSRKIVTKCRKAIQVQANSGDHNFSAEMRDYRKTLTDSEDRQYFPRDNYNPQQYRELLQRNDRLRDAVAFQRARQLFMFLLDLIITNSKAYQKHATETVLSRREEAEEMAELKSELAASETPAATTGTPAATTGTPAATTGTPAATTGTPQASAPSNTLQRHANKRLFDRNSLFDTAALMENYYDVITGEEPFEWANANQASGLAPVTFVSSNNAELQLLTTPKETFETYDAVQNFITNTLQPPSSLSGTLFETMLELTRGIRLEGVSTPRRREVPQKDIRTFFTRVASLPPQMLIKDRPFSSLHLIAINLLKSSHDANSVKTFLFHFNVNGQGLLQTIEQLERTGVTVSEEEKAKLTQATNGLGALIQQRTTAISQFMERSRLEEFQSSAGNILKSPRKLALIYGVLGTGLSALNAFLQTLSELIKNKGNILKHPGEFWKGVMRYYIFKKLFNKSFSILGGVPPINQQEQSFVDKALRNLVEFTGLNKTEKFFKEDRSLPRETLFQFYKAHEHGHGEFIQTEHFIKCMRNLFVDDGGNPQQVGTKPAKINKEFIFARIEQYANDNLSGTAKTEFISKAKGLYNAAKATTGTEDFASIQFVLVSISLRGADVKDPNEMEVLINKHQNQ